MSVGHGSQVADMSVGHPLRFGDPTRALTLEEQVLSCVSHLPSPHQVFITDVS